MFKNFIKVAFRNLVKHKFYSIINILGLAIGLTCSILIGLYIQNELSYDKHNENYKRIYRLESHFKIQDSDDLFAATALPLAPALKVEFPSVEEYVRFSQMDNNLFNYDGEKFFEDNVYYADSTVFNVFTHKFIKGSPEKALTEPNTMVMTESFAHKIFGDENPIGKFIDTGYGFGFTVTAVIEDLQQNSHLTFEALCSMITLAEFYGRERFLSLEPGLFWNIGFYSYIMLKEESNIKDVTDNFQLVYDKYMKEIGDQINSSFDLMVQPLADVHLKSNVTYDLPTGNIAYVYTFGIIAVFLLLLACINYMNMATARSSTRSMEVGIRKVVGAQRTLLQRQFLIESLIITFLSLILAIFITELILPVFNEFSGKTLQIDFFSNYIFLVGIVIIAIFVGLISGSYPAFYLSSFIPVDVLKGSKKASHKGVLRKVLVLLQFSISIIMIIGTFIAAQQLKYFRTKDMGFNDENIVMLTVRDTTGIKNLSSFKDELLQHSNILKAGTTSSIPGQGFGILVQRLETNDGELVEKGVNFVFVDHDYFDVMDMKIIEGRNYDKELQTDLEESILINEALIPSMSWGENAIDKRIQFGAGLDGSATRDTKVIGIIKDFHYTSLHNEIDPLVILLSERPLRNICLKIKGEDIKNTIAFIEEKWNEFCPTFPFDFSFLDDNLNEQYIAEQKIGKVFTYFAFLCVFIACLGLLGLASYTAEQRIKEIGIRKVHGASMNNIIVLLSREFIRWVLLANIIAWPIAYLALDKWLQNFAYRIEVLDNYFIFILSAFIALFIAVFTVIFQAIKSAAANPVDALKYE